MVETTSRKPLMTGHVGVSNAADSAVSQSPVKTSQPRQHESYDRSEPESAPSSAAGSHKLHPELETDSEVEHDDARRLRERTQKQQPKQSLPSTQEVARSKVEREARLAAAEELRRQAQALQDEDEDDDGGDENKKVKTAPVAEGDGNRAVYAEDLDPSVEDDVQAEVDAVERTGDVTSDNMRIEDATGGTGSGATSTERETKVPETSVTGLEAEAETVNAESSAVEAEATATESEAVATETEPAAPQPEASAQQDASQQDTSLKTSKKKKRKKKRRK